MKISEFSLKRPVTTVMITLSMILLGLVSLDRLPLESLPTISSSGISVSVSYNSSSPEEVQRRIVLPLEEKLGTLNNIEEITSSASRNGASVRVNFKSGTDMDLANMEMREWIWPGPTCPKTWIASACTAGKQISVPSSMPAWPGAARGSVWPRSIRRWWSRACCASKG